LQYVNSQEANLGDEVLRRQMINVKSLLESGVRLALDVSDYEYV